MWEPTPDIFRLMVESSPNAVLIADAAGRILWVNPQAERVFRCDRGELLGRSVESLVPERFRAAHAGHRADFHAAPATRPMGVGRDLFCLAKDGAEVPVEIGLVPLRADGAPPLVVAVVTDITARKRQETELRLAREELARRADDLEAVVAKRTENLRLAVEELETFCHTASHDLRAPLRAVQGYASFVLEKLGGRADPESRAMLEKLAEAAERMDHLVKDLLAYNNLIRGEAAMVPVDLDAAVAHVVENYPGVGAADIRIERPLGRATGQAALVIQIVANLVGNAVKFAAPGRAPSIRIWTESAGGLITLSVADNGVGIPREHIPRLFRPFVRLHSDTPREGTGIGLAIVKKAAERMGGRVGVESEVGKGSRFWVELRADVPGP